MREVKITWICAVIFLSVFWNDHSLIAQIKGNKKQVVSDTLDQTPIHINRIYIIGNKKTKRSIITRELSINEGDSVPTYRLPMLLEDDKNKVYNTQLFNTVKIEKLEIDSTEIDLMIKVEERWYFYPAILFKLSDRNFNDWWVNRNHDLNRVNYGLKVYQYNFRGRNERLRLIGQFGFETQLELNYRIPYIESSQRHGLIFDIGYSERKNLAYRTQDHLPTFLSERDVLRYGIGGSITHSYRKSFYTYHYTSFGMYSLNAADTIATLNPNYYGNGESQQKSFRVTYTYTKDYRDNRNYPLNGEFYFAQIDKVGLGIFKDVDIWRFRASYSKYFDLSNGFYFATNAEGMVSTPNNQPYTNYTSLGFGPTLVRGYELELIEGNRYILTKNALRKRLWKYETDISSVMPLEQFQKIPFAFYANLFFDAGWVNNYPDYELNSRLTNKLLYGVGLGIDFITLNDMIVRFEYSYNAENDFNFFINFKSSF